VLSRIEIQRHGQLLGVITLKPLIWWGKINNRWKYEKVLYIFGIQLLVRIHPEQYQIWIFWLVLTVKAELTLMPNFSFGGVVVAEERNYSLQCCWSLCAYSWSLYLPQILLSIKFSIKILSKICPLWQIYFPYILWELLAQRLGDLLFDQVIQVLFLVSCIFAQSTKIWWHCIITFCIAPYHVHHFIIIKSQVCL
jgi:hypothetical protein